ncbi:MAG: tungsten ABC transporter substrate-binding protein [Caldilineae bacterium]|nr:MAG: tungsten ABC transporter substrate-binding protein [Caldilineae bacterium]
MSLRHIVILSFLLFAVAACLPPVGVEQPPAAGTRDELVLATTTSTYDSGLLDYILPDFERKTGIRVRVIAVGTGQALALGKAGDADVLLVHAREREEQFVAEGYAPSRHDVMYNDFVIVGPAEDPAGIRGMTSAAEAFKRIAQAQALFVSRGDDSGTYIKEQKIWQEAGITPQGDWYESAGQGMGAVLNMANEQQAYTLSDRSTFLARQREGLDLEILVEGDPVLFNQYGVLPVTPDKEHDINYGAAIAFVNWITSPETQELIASYGIEQFGSQLFFPNARGNQAGD